LEVDSPQVLVGKLFKAEGISQAGATTEAERDNHSVA